MVVRRIASVVALSAAVMSSPVAASEDSNLSVTLAGGQSFSLILPQQNERKSDINNDFSEMAVTATLKWEAFTYLSVFAKVLHFTGEGNPDKKWNRDQQEWVDVENPVSLSGTWGGAGVMVNSNRDRMFSAGLGLGYGYLDKPDDILNSGHAQFNITADITANLTDRWSVTAGWEHLSNGRQVFKRGGKDSEFYPNNGRDYWTVGATYRF